MSEKSYSSERLGVWFAVIAALGFSFKAIFVKLAYAVAPVEAITLLSLRMLFSAPAFLWVIVSSGRHQPSLSARDWTLLGILGLLGYYGASILDFWGLQYISAGLERLILFTYPTLILLINVVFMGKALHRREIGSLLISYAGIGLAFWHDLKIAGDMQWVLIGAAFVFGSSLSYAFYQAGSEVAIRRFGAARFTALATLVSVGATQIHFFAAQPLSAYAQPAPVLLYALGMALFSTVLPVFMQSAAIRRIGSAQAALIGMLGPVLTIFFGWLLLDESISVAQMAGTALVIAGVLLVSRR